jgi:hypothetical protein
MAALILPVEADRFVLHFGPNGVTIAPTQADDLVGGATKLDLTPHTHTSNRSRSRSSACPHANGVRSINVASRRRRRTIWLLVLQSWT